MIGKDKILDKPRMDAEMVPAEVIIDKSLVEVTAEIEAGKTLGEIIIIMIGADQEKEAPHPEGILLDDVISQVQNSGSRSRSNSRVTTNRDRIRYFRCREYDHFANECPNTGIEDSDGYESDSAALQLMVTDIETHDSYDITRLTEEIEHLN